MQRNIGSEFRVALAAIVLLTLPVIFALLLINQSDTGEDDTAATQTAQAPRISILTSTPAEVAQVDETQEVVVSVSPTATPTETSTPTDEPTTLTETALPTETTTATATSSLSVLQVRTPTASESDETKVAGVTPSRTRRPSATPSATATTETATTPPSSTPTSTQTHTPRPSRTPMPTDTASPTGTSRPTEDDFAGILPTPTLPASPTAAAVDAATREPASCELPRGWTTYRVQPGDTLFAIALATNSTVSELRYANCIEDVDNITSEETVFVPRAPLRPVSTLIPSAVRPGLAAFGCDDPRAQITSPAVAATVSGVFTVRGTATREDFGYYKIEVRPDWAEIYNFYLDSFAPVENDVLGLINAELFGDGLHWVRLTVVDERAGIPPGATCEVPLIFE